LGEGGSGGNNGKSLKDALKKVLVFFSLRLVRIGPLVAPLLYRSKSTF